MDLKLFFKVWAVTLVILSAFGFFTLLLLGFFGRNGELAAGHVLIALIGAPAFAPSVFIGLANWFYEQIKKPRTWM